MNESRHTYEQIIWKSHVIYMNKSRHAHAPFKSSQLKLKSTVSYDTVDLNHLIRDLIHVTNEPFKASQLNHKSTVSYGSCDLIPVTNEPFKSGVKSTES